MGADIREIIGGTRKAMQGFYESSLAMENIGKKREAYETDKKIKDLKLKQLESQLDPKVFELTKRKQELQNKQLEYELDALEGYHGQNKDKSKSYIDRGVKMIKSMQEQGVNASVKYDKYGRPSYGSLSPQKANTGQYSKTIEDNILRGTATPEQIEGYEKLQGMKRQPTESSRKAFVYNSLKDGKITPEEALRKYPTDKSMQNLAFQKGSVRQGQYRENEKPVSSLGKGAMAEQLIKNVFQKKDISVSENEYNRYGEEFQTYDDVVGMLTNPSGDPDAKAKARYIKKYIVPNFSLKQKTELAKILIEGKKLKKAMG